MMTRREFLAAGLVVGTVPSLRGSAGADVRVVVFSLFRPSELVVRDVVGRGLALTTASGTMVVRKETARLAAADGVNISVNDRHVRAASVLVSDLAGGSVECELEVPGKIVRRFRGRVEVAAHGRVMTATVTMPLESAVASVVAAELPAVVSVEAAKAQAVAARSYFAASRGRHDGGTFCDTTHCQFMREEPAVDHVAARAARDTQGWVVSYQGRVVEVLYSASCGGRTQTVTEAGFPGGGYPFFAVECAGCQASAPSWRRELRLDAETRRFLEHPSESARLAIVRRDGWDTIPGQRFTVVDAGASVTLIGRGRGHGVGLCQHGAAVMASAGASCADILSHYLPATRLIAGA
jgi:stage II sporulation protein D